MQSLIEHEVIHICHFTWATVNVQYYIKKYKTGYSNADLNYVMVIVGTSNLEEKKKSELPFSITVFMYILWEFSISILRPGKQIISRV